MHLKTSFSSFARRDAALRRAAALAGRQGVPPRPRHAHRPTGPGRAGRAIGRADQFGSLRHAPARQPEGLHRAWLRDSDMALGADFVGASDVRNWISSLPRSFRPRTGRCATAWTCLPTQCPTTSISTASRPSSPEIMKRATSKARHKWRTSTDGRCLLFSGSIPTSIITRTPPTSRQWRFVTARCTVSACFNRQLGLFP